MPISTPFNRSTSVMPLFAGSQQEEMPDAGRGYVAVAHGLELHFFTVEEHHREQFVERAIGLTSLEQLVTLRGGKPPERVRP